MAILFARSAAKHRINAIRVQYVLEHHVWTFDVDNGVTLLLGPDRQGVDLEVGTRKRGDDVLVIHAIKVRPQFLDEYRRHLPWPR